VCRNIRGAVVRYIHVILCVKFLSNSDLTWPQLCVRVGNGHTGKTAPQIIFYVKNIYFD